MIALHTFPPTPLSNDRGHFRLGCLCRTKFSAHTLALFSPQPVFTVLKQWYITTKQTTQTTHCMYLHTHTSASRSILILLQRSRPISRIAVSISALLFSVSLLKLSEALYSTPPDRVTRVNQQKNKRTRHDARGRRVFLSVLLLASMPNCFEIRNAPQRHKDHLCYIPDRSSSFVEPGMDHCRPQESSTNKRVPLKPWVCL